MRAFVRSGDKVGVAELNARILKAELSPKIAFKLGIDIYNQRLDGVYCGEFDSAANLHVEISESNRNRNAAYYFMKALSIAKDNYPNANVMLASMVMQDELLGTQLSHGLITADNKFHMSYLLYMKGLDQYDAKSEEVYYKNALFNLAHLILSDKLNRMIPDPSIRYQKAAELLCKAASLDDFEASYDLANLIFKHIDQLLDYKLPSGIVITKQTQHALLIAYLYPAANAEYPEAQFLLAYLIESGKLNGHCLQEENDEEDALFISMENKAKLAFDWYLAAAENDCAKSYYNLGCLIGRGKVKGLSYFNGDVSIVVTNENKDKLERSWISMAARLALKPAIDFLSRADKRAADENSASALTGAGTFAHQDKRARVNNPNDVEQKATPHPSLG